jgi:uracil-DNA glycosylase family 4
MNLALAALTDELRRLQAAGVKRVTVSEEGLAALRTAARAAPAAAPSAPAADEPPSSGPQGRHSPPRPAPPGPTPPRRSPPPADEAGRPPEAKPPVAPSGPPPPSLADLRARLQRLPDKESRWAALRDLIRDDPHCRSHLRPGKQVVVGVGDVNARIFFVGEAPGAEEEVRGEPFVGPAGQLLDRMIAAMGLERREVYIGNIMNWRPEMPVEAGGTQYGNRPPTPAEMAYCLPYLLAQVELVDPAVLVALGATASRGLLGAGAFKALGEVRGRWHDFAGKPLMVTYHPSFILRNQTNRSKRLIWEDLLQVMERAGLPVSAKQRRFFSDK